MRNVVKHSGADSARLVLAVHHDTISLTVQDEGSGFDTTHAREAGGLGLISIEERVRLLDGRLDVDSRPGSGTTLRITLPNSHEPAGPAAVVRAQPAADEEVATLVS